MKCTQVQKRLSTYQDGELDPQEEERIKGHLESCSACRVRYEGMEKIWQALGDSQEIIPDPGFYGQLVKKINESNRASFPTGFRWLFQGFSSSWATSTLLIAGILIGAYLGSLLGRSDLFSLQPSPAVGPRAASEVFSLKAFDPLPPGTLGDQYIRMASQGEGDRR
jgi:anti-sigma factor RsiW